MTRLIYGHRAPSKSTAASSNYNALFGTLLIEQPFHYDDLLDHAWLQGQLQTPICLDESIQSPEHARWALELDACRVVNIKVSRVGGFTAARQIQYMRPACDSGLVWRDA